MRNNGTIIVVRHDGTKFEVEEATRRLDKDRLAESCDPSKDLVLYVRTQRYTPYIQRVGAGAIKQYLRNMPKNRRASNDNA